MKILNEKSNTRKAQSAIEFVILVMAILLLFIGLLYFFQNKIADSQYQALSALVNEAAKTVQDEINLAHSSSNGYSRQFTLPSSLNGQEYTAQITEGFIYVKTDDERHAIALPVLNVTGQVIIGNNLVYKIDDSVYLN